MTIEIKAPSYPESVQEGTLVTWHKKTGDSVERDELIADIETDKVVLEVPSPASGVLVETLKSEGDIIRSAELIAKLDETIAKKDSDVEQIENKIESTQNSKEVPVLSLIHI